MVTISMMPSKMTTLGFSKIKVFWTKNDDVITNRFYNATQMIL